MKDLADQPLSDPEASCFCATLDDLAVVPMRGDGLDERVFASLDRVRDHGGQQWWLYASRCQVCSTFWLIAQDERIYDNFYLRRLSPQETEGILESGHWPADFMTYERVLSCGRRLSTPPRFFDAFAYSLQFTVEDLRNERKNIDPKEIGELLGLGELHAQLLYWKVRLLGAKSLT